jgi:hypothetical protein
VKAPAFLLVGEGEDTVAVKFEKVLQHFGVEGARISGNDFLSTPHNSAARLLCSTRGFEELTAILADDSGAMVKWRCVSSVFVCAVGPSDCFIKVAQTITGDKAAALASTGPNSRWNVSEDFVELSASMSAVSTPTLNGEPVLFLNPALPGVVPIISCDSGVGFVRVLFNGVPVFLSVSGVINVDAPLVKRTFDVREHFMAAVPIVLYMKWALAAYCWRSAVSCACLVIDDPLLQPRYGYLNYKRLLALMERLNFSTSIAFIPWNWRRSARTTVRLFQENAGRFSISIHGCDHTDAEYGGSDQSRLAWKSHQAGERMSRHRSRTGLAHDKVMIFPQGVFSESAIESLKRDDFIAVVNSEVFSDIADDHRVRISDYWNVAVTNYCDFPIFTRRYPSQGIQNFAFDILLGKPCIIVAHHSDCADDCQDIAHLVQDLNALKVTLGWTSLAEIVRTGYRQREISASVIEAEIPGVETKFDNQSQRPVHFRVTKSESVPAAIRDVRVDGQSVPWSPSDDGLMFELTVEPRQAKIARIRYKPSSTPGYKGEPLTYWAKAMARRYLCEIRDNYLTRKVKPS